MPKKKKTTKPHPANYQKLATSISSHGARVSKLPSPLLDFDETRAFWRHHRRADYIIHRWEGGGRGGLPPWVLRLRIVQRGFISIPTNFPLLVSPPPTIVVIVIVITRTFFSSPLFLFFFAFFSSPTTTVYVQFSNLHDNRVRALARNPEKAAELFGASGDLEIVTADCRDASALDASGVARDVDAVVSCTGTTAFPSARWKDGNGPEQTDFIGTSNLVAAVASQSSASCKRFVLVSSIGVKRTDQMPFIILNAFGVLKYKGMGEQALMNSGLPFTILRPGRLTDGPYTSYDINTLLKARRHPEGGARGGGQEDVINL